MTNKIIFGIAALACLFLPIPAAIALLAGIIVSTAFGNPYLSKTKKWSSQSLMFAVAGLGAGMNLSVVAKVGMSGLGYTFFTITLTMIVGLLLGGFYKVPRGASLLIASGTAICGGSAIAAVASAVKSKEEDISMAMAVVFILNAAALFIFPELGHLMGFDQNQFGLWSALAVHDTSSVVGTSMRYGQQALEVGTTVKLARALWIIPLSITIGLFQNMSKKNRSLSIPKVPWFIVAFIILAGIVTWIPQLQVLGKHVSDGAKHLLVLALFLIGSNLQVKSLKALGAGPLIQGFTLWIIVAASTAAAISFKLIQL